MPLTEQQEAMRQKCELVNLACNVVNEGIAQILEVPGIESKISEELLSELKEYSEITVRAISSATHYTTAEAFESVNQQTFEDDMKNFGTQLQKISGLIQTLAAVAAPAEENISGYYSEAPPETGNAAVSLPEELLVHTGSPAQTTRYHAPIPEQPPVQPPGVGEETSPYNTGEVNHYNTAEVDHYNTAEVDRDNITAKKEEISLGRYGRPPAQPPAQPPIQPTNPYGGSQKEMHVYSPIPHEIPTGREPVKPKSSYGGFSPPTPGKEEKTAIPIGGTEPPKTESSYGRFRDLTTPGEEKIEGPPITHGDLHEEEALISPTVSAIPSTAKAAPSLDQNYDDILMELDRTKNVFTSEIKDKVLTKSFDHLIGLFQLSRIKGELTTEPQLTKAKHAISQLSEQIQTIGNKKFSDETKEKLLSDFTALSKEVLDHLDARKGRMLGLHAEYHLVPYNGDEISYRSTLDAAIKKHFPEAPAPSGKSFATTQATAPSQSTEALDDKHYRVGKMKNGAILTDRVENGQARTELVSIPKELNPELMWKETYQSLSVLYSGKYILQEDQFNHLTEWVMGEAKRGNKDIDEKDIRNFLMHQVDGNAKEYAKEIFDTFSTHYKPYHKTKYGDFPNDKLIAIAIQQIESRREADRSNPNIVLTTAFSPAYAKAIELYSRAMNYTFVNESEYRPKIDKGEVKAFLKLLEKTPGQYHYNDTHRLSAMAEKVIPEMKASHPIKGH